MFVPASQTNVPKGGDLGALVKSKVQLRITEVNRARRRVVGSIRSVTDEARKAINFDHPDAFDTELMVEDLKRLKAGETIHCPVYDYTIHNRTDKTIEIKPTKVVIVEGILIFQNKALRDLLDIKIFVETDADVRILRRALRDVEERGRSMQSVVEQYLATVKPMHEQFVEPTRKYADIVVLEGGHNLVALDLIMQRIANHIAEN